MPYRRIRQRRIPWLTEPTSRLRTLRATGLLDSPPEAAFDRLTRLVATLTGMPVALVSLVDEARQFFKSTCGTLPEPWGSRRETPLSYSFCAHVVERHAPLVVSDAREEPLVRDNLAVRELGVRAYAGVPLVVQGQPLGAFCVVDDKPHRWTAAELALLEDIGASVVSEIELRLALRVAEQRQALTLAMLDAIGDGVLAVDASRAFVFANPTARAWLPEVDVDALLPTTEAVARPTGTKEGRPVGLAETPLVRGLRGEATDGLLLHEDGAAGERWIDANARPVRAASGELLGAVAVYRDVTGRVRADDSRERRFRELYDASPDMFATIDVRDGRILECNATLCRRLGYTKAELVGRRVWTLYVSEEQAPANAGFHEAATVSDRELVDAERRMVCKSGEIFDASLSVRAVRDGEGGGFRFATWRDISRRKQAERDQAFHFELCSRYETATDVGVALATVGEALATYLCVERCFLLSLPRASTTLEIRPGYASGGVALPDTLALDAIGFTPETARKLPYLVAADVAKTELPGGMKRECARYGLGAFVVASTVHADATSDALAVATAGPRAWEEREVALVRLVGARLCLWIDRVRLLGRLRERLVAEAVEAHDRRLHVLVDAVRDYAIYQLDPEGRVATWNRGASRLTQWTAAEIVGQPYEVMFPPDAPPGHARAILARAAAEGRYQEEGFRVRKDGTRFWADVVVTAIRDPAGNLEGFAKVVRDVSERRRRDEELATKQTELVASLREREVLLQEVHHRVKNNLQVISSLINMQGRRLEPGAAKEALRECQSRVQTIALIHDQLYQSREYARVRFGDYVRSLVSQVFAASGVQSGGVELRLDATDVALSIDRALPCALLLNELVTNAFKHAFRERSGMLTVSVRGDAEGRVTMAVADDGPGLPGGFDPRSRATTGMQIIVALVAQLGGTLAVGAPPGASFVVVFPATAGAV